MFRERVKYFGYSLWRMAKRPRLPMNGIYDKLRIEVKKICQEAIRRVCLYLEWGEGCVG